MATITGSIDVNQVAVGSGTDTIAGSNQLTFDGSEFAMADASANRWIDANFGTGPDAHSFGIGDLDESFNGTRILGNDTAQTLLLFAGNTVQIEGNVTVEGAISIISGQGTFQLPGVSCATLASLPAATGMMICVGDYNASPGIGAVVTPSSGGGSGVAIVWYNGTDWKIFAI